MVLHATGEHIGRHTALTKEDTPRRQGLSRRGRISQDTRTRDEIPVVLVETLSFLSHPPTLPPPSSTPPDRELHPTNLLLGSPFSLHFLSSPTWSPTLLKSPHLSKQAETSPWVEPGFTELCPTNVPIESPVLRRGNGENQ